VSQVQSCYAVTRAQSARADFNELPFSDADVELACEKKHKSKKERRKLKFEGSVESRHVEELLLPEGPPNMIIPEDIAELQRQDSTLQDWFQKVSEVDGVRKDIVSCLMEEKYILKKGILYQVKGEVEALVLPESMRHTIMTLVYSVPWAGHLGKHKTLARITSRFTWPKYIRM